MVALSTQARLPQSTAELTSSIPAKMRPYKKNSAIRDRHKRTTFWDIANGQEFSTTKQACFRPVIWRLRRRNSVTVRFTHHRTNGIGTGQRSFSVPGSPRDPRHKGINGLLRDGAILTKTAQDIISQISPMLKTVAASQEFAKLLPETTKNISETETTGAHDEVMNYWATSR
jgi:hypothetical protein